MPLVRGTNCGFVESAPSSDPATSNWTFDDRAVAFKDTSPGSATKVTEIGVWVDNATEAADLVFGIYTHNAGDDNPEVLVGSVTIAKGTTSGWKKQSCNIAISSDTIYWIAAQLDNTATATSLNMDITGVNEFDYKLSQTDLVDPWGVSSGGYDNRLLGVYAVWESVAPEVIPLTGTIDAVSSVLGSVKVSRKIVGSIVAVSSLVGSVKVSRKISGVIAATSSLSGTLSLVGEVSRSRGSGFKPIEGAERLRGLRRSAFY